MSEENLVDAASSQVKATLDTGMIPLGERSWQKILDHVIAVGDEAETTYLEVKSALDMSGKAATAKIAKFLLGSANRRPQEATQHFHGYAVLVIGAEKGNASGVARGTEGHELEEKLRPYLGPLFPSFEFGRIPVDADHEVLFIIAQPPEQGQPIFPCHKNYQGNGGDRRDNLDDGAIYVRGTSNTRPARAGEVLALVERARGGGKSPITLDVGVLGTVHRVVGVPELLDTLFDLTDEKFLSAPEPPKKPWSSTFQAPSLFGESKPPTHEERQAALTRWRQSRPQNMAEGREHFLGAALQGAGICAVSHDRFVAKPHLVVTFQDCELIEYIDPSDVNVDKIVPPVIRHRRSIYEPMDYSNLPFQPIGHPVSWSTRGQDAEVVLTPESLRPNTEWRSEQDDYVLLARDPEATAVMVSWVLTEEGNDATTTGEFTVPTTALIEARDLISTLIPDEDDND